MFGRIFVAVRVRPLWQSEIDDGHHDICRTMNKVRPSMASMSIGESQLQCRRSKAQKAGG